MLLVNLILKHGDVLDTDPLPQIMRYISVAACVKDDIILAQPAGHRLDEPPDFLPPSIVTFLGRVCNLTDALVNDFWVALKGTIWHGEAGATGQEKSMEDLFRKHGQDLGFRTYSPLISSQIV